MNKQNHFYCPALIDAWSDYFYKGILDDGTIEHRYAFVRNIGYSLQYLEYLDNLILTSNLHETVLVQSFKSFIVIGMGIIEALLYYILKKNNLNKQYHWEMITEQQSGSYSEGQVKYRIINKVEKELIDPVDIEMKLVWMIRKVESKKLLGIKEQVYKDLNYLRKLRNRLHIHQFQNYTDTDFNAFRSNEVKLMKKVLHSVLSADPFTSNNQDIGLLKFLLIEERTDELIPDVLFDEDDIPF